jgi:hypothetical protein|tara:strand:+ start:201 stop:902 length:702 start_codon:yes stop_codon:yes gene_type:complete
MFDWLGDILDNAGDAVKDIFDDATSSEAIKSYLGMGLAGLLGNFDEPNIPVVGYQGSIPEYQAVRQRVAMPEDPNRRPGAGGRRYFTDTIFAQKPETTPMTVEQAQAAAAAQAQGLAGLNPTYDAPPTGTKDKKEDTGMAGPKKVFMAGGRYLSGATDGMADKVPANVGREEVRLSDGEFVIPADVVSHLGNGNSNAGAAFLHKFMNDVRQERTGNAKQGKEINPKDFVRGMA